MNPARSYGPAIASWDFTNQWIYIVGACTGAIIAVVIAFLLRGVTTKDAIEAASGKLAGEQEAHLKRDAAAVPSADG